MATYSNKFKCVLHFNTFEERMIMYNDMTYSLLLESVVKRFNLDPNARFNLSFNLPAIERDITNDEDVKFFIDCATNYINDEIPHLYSGGHDNILTTQEYVRKVYEDVSRDEHFMQGPWLSAILYLYGQGVSVSGCLGDMNKNCIKGKLELVVGVVKSCTPNSLGYMTVTLKDLTGEIDISCDMIPPGIDTDDDSEGERPPFEEPLDDVLFPLPKDVRTRQSSLGSQRALGDELQTEGTLGF
ncbi:hypothetical protein Tco_0840764 [Tanacetum coccineum]|uniref:Uncharacterized protein n=1 Tax=Tanacetum coccineum TaxID=301880 RepID=A0ABQ5AWY2_9ASTR